MRPRSRNKGVSMKGGVGEIVQVQGGHIIRSTGRKDRHSKVYTAKGPRDRRVRLSAHTAIQFYDVQDRLGCDRPSKAVDWLIKKAKAAIDKLAELPPVDPSNHANPSGVDGNRGWSNTGAEGGHSNYSSGYAVQLQGHVGDSSPSNNESYANSPPQGIDSQTIADTVKSFFPATSAANSISFHSYPAAHMIPRGGGGVSQTQDLCLSLHTIQDPKLIHSQAEEGNSAHHHSADQSLFTGSVTMGFDPSSGGWNGHHPPDIGHFSRLMAWSTSDSGNVDGRGVGGAAGLILNSLPIASSAQQALFGQSTLLSQKGTGIPLQSAGYSPFRSWDDLPGHHKAQVMHHATVSAIGPAGADGFMGFCIPSQIHGEQVHRSVGSDKASSSISPNSSH